MTLDNDTETVGSAPGFLSGGGEMGALLRQFDWSATSLGRPADWPQSLKIAVRIMLTSRQPFWIGWGDDLVYLYNDAYKSIIGGKHPWALGRPVAEVWQEIWGDIRPMLATAMTGIEGTYVESQLLIMERNGYPEETYYTFSYSPIPRDDGKAGGIICANTDDTQRVINERQIALLRALAANTVDARTREAACERSAAALASNPRDLPFAMIYLADGERSVMSLAGLSTPDLAGDAVPRTLTTDGPAPWPVEEILRNPDRQIVANPRELFGDRLPTGGWPIAPHQAAIIPIPASADTGPAGALIVGLNPFRLFDEGYRGFLGLAAGQIGAAITNAQAYEEERRRAEALAAIDHAKTVFFSNVSHEFRTPLTLMLGPLEEALNDASSPPLPPAQRDRLEVAHRNSQRLLKLVNMLLDFSRIGAGRVEAQFEPTDLAAFTAELASNFRSAMDMAGLEFEIDCPRLSAPVFVDRDMWEKILLNLLSNAFKFTFDGKVTVRLRQRDARRVELTVADSGVGVPADEIPRLFERFHRVEGQRSRSFEGSGIGLALVHELVRLHGGTIRAESEVGKGTAFIMTIPTDSSLEASNRPAIAPNRAATSPRVDSYVEEALQWLPTAPDKAGAAGQDASDDDAAEPGDRASRPSILFADDNPDMRDYASRLLGRRWRVRTVRDGREALAAIREQKPDLLLTDVMMPRLDGFGLLREIRADAALGDLPVILLSARAGEEARVEGLDFGADDYLTKPFSARELVARVNANLELARSRQEGMTALRASEEALRRRTEQFEKLLSEAPIGVYLIDADFRIREVNPVARPAFGDIPDLIGRDFAEVVHRIWPQNYADEVVTRFRHTLETGEPYLVPEEIEQRRDRQATEYYEWRISRIPLPEGAFGVVCYFRDVSFQILARRELHELNATLEQRVARIVSEHKETEAQLRQAQKMEAVGKLTGGVAHDFNNLLQVIGSNLQLLAKDLAGNDKGETRIRNALAGVSRGSKLAAQLLAFGRRQPLAPKVVNLGRLIRGMDDMLRRALGEAIEVETIVAGGLWNTLIDAPQMENVLLNLAINSRDAMEGRGRLTIEAGNASLDDHYAQRQGDLSPGQYVMIAVTDTGCGISGEIMEQIFEPFFTTKPEGHGTGLGLSMVYGFIKQSGGHIKVYSELRHGTTIRIYLPRSRQQEDVLAEIDTGPVAGGTETVLVVEDDDEVRASVVDLLTDLGYRLLKAKDADAALAILDSGVPIDLLFTDVVMPGSLRSPELARQAQQRFPNLAVLFTSGYTDNAIVHGGRLDEDIELLSKPYTREALARKVRHVLRNQRPAAPPSRTAKKDMAGLRVLLVEDDKLVRAATAEMLEELGHRVFEGATADAALAIIEAQAIDVLVTDVNLPGTSGFDLAARVRRHDPGLKIVFASGQEPPPLSAADSRLLSDAIFLCKPYSEQDLAEALKP